MHEYIIVNIDVEQNDIWHVHEEEQEVRLENSTSDSELENKSVVRYPDSVEDYIEEYGFKVVYNTNDLIKYERVEK